jgi:AcrR family transcriptional regulator
MSMVSKNMTDRRTRRRNRTRISLLDAARAVLARLGYQATTVADITHEADVGVGTFYLHFHDKDALLHTLLEEGLDQLHDEIVQHVRQVPLECRLPIAIHAIATALFAHRDLIRIAYTSGHYIGLVQRGQMMLAEHLENAIRAAQTLGMVDPARDAALTASLISGMIIQSAMWWSDHASPAPDLMADHIIQLLRDGLPAALFATVPERQE